jgi:hypothetical protein
MIDHQEQTKQEKTMAGKSDAEIAVEILTRQVAELVRENAMLTAAVVRLQQEQAVQERQTSAP